MKISNEILNEEFERFLVNQTRLEQDFCKSNQKSNAAFLTNNALVIDLVLKKVPEDKSIFDSSFLEPACGQGVFLIKVILKAFSISSNMSDISTFIEKKIFFVDIDPYMIDITKNNISSLFLYLFNCEYKGRFNSFVEDFSNLEIQSGKTQLADLYESVDYVIGNPPYISLYGRRDQKKNEDQRIYFLKNYEQFPSYLKNGKINYVMLFIERGLRFLKKGGILSFVIDTSFFETAYEHCRKYLVENYTIESLTYNVQGFENVASGQTILMVSNNRPKDNSVLVTNNETKDEIYVKQDTWNRPDDEYKFRISHCAESDSILEKIFSKGDKTLKEMYPKKNLRTCVMLLNMEERFTTLDKSCTHPSYPYYKGSSGLKYKYAELCHSKYFNYDKALQDSINDELKQELILKGVKNKKRIGLGELSIYDNPKVYIRQSAKELIASYEEKPSSANNSLYVFSLRESSTEAKFFLKYLCGLMNSTLYTFFAQQRRIIRYNKGKQPQIKTSDLYQIFIPENKNLRKCIVDRVESIYDNPQKSESHQEEIDKLIYDYYKLNVGEVSTINRSVESFLQ